MHTYNTIIEYFQTLAERDPSIAHHATNNVAYIVADIQDALSGQNTFLKSPYMIAGYEPEGIDRGAGSYTFAQAEKAERVYSINIGIFKEAASAKKEAAMECLEALDEIADSIFAIIEADRLAAFNGNDPALRCFHKSMALDVPIYKTSVSGNNRALGIILNFTFSFNR